MFVRFVCNEMSVIEKIKGRLQNYPQIEFEATQDSIVVFPQSESGFEVSLYFNDRASDEPYNVFFNGWHEAFQSEAVALDCFALGLSSECRLKEYSRGENPYKWTIEYLRDGRWEVGGSSTTLLFLSFWKVKKVRYLQNEQAI